MDKLLTPDEAAAILGVGPDWVRRRCQAGELEHIKLGPSKQAQIRIEQRALWAFVAGRVVQAKQPRTVLTDIKRRNQRAS